MSWLWKDKKTEQLKSVLHTAFEDDKKSTANRLTKMKNDAKEIPLLHPCLWLISPIQQGLIQKPSIYIETQLNFNCGSINFKGEGS